MVRNLFVECLLVGAIVVSASGCSIKLVYNNADRFARWAVNDYIHMTDEQEAYFDAEVDAIHYWHRTSELPLYADYLDALPGKLDDGVSVEEVQDIFETLFAWWEVFEEKAMPMVTELMLSLTDEQVADLPSRLAKDNEEFAEDEEDRPVHQVQAEWAREYADAVSRFSGRLTREQKDYLAAQSVRYLPQFELWADYHRRWQGDLLKLLNEKRDDPKAFREAFQQLTDNREAYYGEELTAVFNMNEALAKEVTAWMLSHLNDAQRARFETRIGEMATAFRELAEEVPDQVPQGGGCLVRC